MQDTQYCCKFQTLMSFPIPLIKSSCIFILVAVFADAIENYHVEFQDENSNRILHCFTKEDGTIGEGSNWHIYHPEKGVIKVDTITSERRN